jgi:predicted PurR-regulated permease PerM
MDRRVFFALATFAFLAFLLWIVFAIVEPFLRSLGWAAVIGVLTYPLYRRLRAAVGGKEILAASLMTPAVVLTLVLPVVGLVVFLAQELTQVLSYLEETTTGGLSFVEGLRQHPTLAPWLAKTEATLVRLGIHLDKMLVPMVEKVSAFALSYSTAIVVNFFAFAIKLILMVITLFFIYRDGERLQEQFWSVIPLAEEQKDLLAENVKRVLKAVIFGIFLTCVVQGGLGAFGFWFCGLPSPLLFGAMMAVSALIPVVGTALIWAPGAAYLILEGDTTRGMALILWGGLVVSFVDNIIRPFFISGKGHIPVLVVAIGALGGLVSFGLLGVVLGPLVLSLFIAIFDIYKTQIFLPEDAGWQ